MEIHIGADGKVIVVFFVDNSDMRASSSTLHVSEMTNIINNLLCDESITEIKIVKK